MSSPSTEIRRVILEQAHRAGVGHIGSALSVADIMASLLLAGALADGGPDRDRFVMSKGHAALALYAALYKAGRISQAALDTYCGDGTPFGAHPEHVVEGIDFSTGSLGQGLAIGAGAALAARIQGSARHVVVLMSDAEQNEGSVWESAMFARHHSLGNLSVIVDLNEQQAFGYTRDVLDVVAPDIWDGFGWDVREVDGHDVDALADLLRSLRTTPRTTPAVVLARTVFGRGVSYMERQIKWHYFPMSEEQFTQAMSEVGT